MIVGWGTLSSPDDGYFICDPRPMSDQRSDKKVIPGNREYMFVLFFCLKLEPEILNCQILSAVLSRTINTLSTR